MNEIIGLIIGSPIIIFFLFVCAVILGPIFFMPFIKEARGGFWQIIIFMVVGYLLYEFFIGY